MPGKLKYLSPYITIDKKLSTISSSVIDAKISMTQAVTSCFVGLRNGND